MIKLTKTEQVIMEVLWAGDEPMLLSDIVRAVENQKRKIAKNSIQPMLKKLIDNGYVKIAGTMLVNKSVSRYYLPNITVDEYAADQFDSLVNASDGHLKLGKFLSFFINSKKENSSDIISEVEEFIENYKNSEK